ncbi:MAG: PQQ-binding-like beta-propeller repeat protein [Candidatus Aminicenantes bacterium]|nr:MAG: PQQ-binding-like beta-propeller repeat protein [Candidatus Aminicenantes bacterium]
MKKKMEFSLLVILPIVLILCSTCCSKSEETGMAVKYDVPSGSENWPSFRGVNGSGLAQNQGLPLEWDVKSGKNIKWYYETQGLGLSSPVIWEDRVFITTAIDQVADDSSLKVGLYGDVVSVENENPHTWEVICLDRDTGKEMWKKEAFRGVPKIKRHPKSSHASSTAATDGKHVVAFFGSEGLYCYDFEGNLLWKRDFGVLDSSWYTMPEAQWEFGSSPIIHDGKVIIQVDVQKDSFIAALNIENGETIWKTDRNEIPTWSSPTIYEGSDRTQVIVNGYKHIGSYDFKTGEPIWWLKGGGDIPVPTPVIGFDNVYITSSHGRMRPIYAIKLDAVGDITPTDEKNLNEHVSWFYPRKGAYLPTPLVYGDYFYVCRINGIMTCFDAKTGEEIYKQRVGSMQGAFTASPVAADSKLYLADEYGDVHIVQAGPEYKHLATNKLHESCLATPAISGNMLFVRTIGHLFAIGKGGETKGIQTRVEEEEPVEKIDFSSVRTDGSIQDPQELIKIVSAKFRTITSVEYDTEVKGAESEEETFGTLTSKAKLWGYASGFPEYFHIEGSHEDAKKESTSEFITGSDGNEYYYVDKDENTIKKGVEFSDVGTDFQKVQFILVTEFVSDDPLSMEKSDGKLTINGIKKINDEGCYELSCAFPQYGNNEIIWFVSIKDFLPYGRTVKYIRQDGKRGGFVQTLSSIKINQHSKPNIYQIKNLKDYQIE